MDTRKIAAEYRLSHWAQAMQERASGRQSIKEFCEERGISRNTYFYWQRKLRNAACEAMESPEFAEVKLLEAPVQAVRTEACQSGQVLVEVAGVHITADSGYPAEKLSTLLKALVLP